MPDRIQVPPPFFVTVLVWPLHREIQRRAPAKFGWIAVVLTMSVIVIVLALFGGGIWLIVHQITTDTERMERYAEQWRQQWKWAEAWLRERSIPVPGDNDGGVFIAHVFDWAQLVAHSMLNLTRSLLSLRRSEEDLLVGSYLPLPAPDGVLAYQRGEGWAVVLNLTDKHASWRPPRSGEIVLSTHQDEPERSGGKLDLRPGEGLLLRLS